MKPSPEIEAIARRVVSARARDEVDAVRGLYSGSDWLQLIGSDEHEWYSGSEALEIRKAHWEEWPAYQTELRRVAAFEEGNAGWAALEELRTYPDGRTSVFRRSLVLEMEDGAWKIVHSHFSAPVANLEATGVELTRSLSDLVESVEAESGLSPVAFQASGVATSTFIFTDIVDSTLLSQSMGDQTWSVVVSDHLHAVRTAVEDEGGSVVKTLGDGGMYTFNSGSSALKAAIQIQRAVAASSESQIRIRVGIHTGDVVHSRGDYLGLTVSKAARVTAAAKGGQILVSLTTEGVVNPAEFEFGAPIVVELKGIPGVHHLRQLHWSESRPSTRT